MYLIIEIYYLPQTPQESKQKTIDEHGKKQVKALQFSESPGKELPEIKKFISKGKLKLEIMNDLGNIREQEQQIDRIKMLYKGV